MSKTVLQVVYDGAAVAEGSMDVRELAPALLAFGDLCQESNRTLNGDRAQASVRVRSDFRTGSFEVALDLQVLEGLVGQAKSFLLGDDLKAAKELAGLVFGSSAGAISLYGLFKLLRGKKPTKTEVQPNGNIHLEINATHIEVQGNVARLYNNSRVREAVRRTVAPLEREGIDTFEVRHENVRREVIHKQDLPAFTAAADETEPLVAESTRIAAFEVVTLSFEDRYKWRFSDGSGTFTADIEDETFFQRLQRREVSFGKGDVLKVEIRSRTWRTDRGLRTEHKVLGVLEVIPAPEQIPLREALDPPVRCVVSSAC
jgi:hypothetical protein